MLLRARKMIKLIVSIDDSQELGTKIHHMKSEKITEKNKIFKN